MSDADLTSLVAATALRSTVADLPSHAVTTIKRSILDLLACCVAGSRADSARIAAEWASDGAPGGDATVIGTTRRLAPPLAALVNGTSAHALDFDDVSMRMIHPSTTVVPALLAVGEARHLTGRALLDGYLAGFEVQARLCRELNPEHYLRGWHTTGTIGPLGTAMAVARAFGLDETQARYALGIAASSSSSIRRNFGSMVKPLHAGEASFHGLLAVGLAERGFTASSSVLEGTNGFLEVFSSPELADALRAAFSAEAPYELVESGIALKRFASCGAIHSALDAVIELQSTDAFELASIQSVEVRVNSMVPGILVHHVTSSGLEGKFSMEYSVAVVLMDGRAGLAQYTDERAVDPALRSLMEKVHVVVDESIPLNQAYFPSIVSAHLDDGVVRSTRVDVPQGYPQHPLSEDEVIAKVHDCCTPMLSTVRVAELIDTVLRLEELDDVARLGTLLSLDGEGE